MRHQPEEKLPIGRAAFAKAFCADWISDHSKTILFSFATVLVLSFTLFQMMGKFSTGSKSDYLEAQRAFNAWSEDENLDPKLLKNLEQPLGRHPELQAKFGNHIAQRLLTLGDAKKAAVYASASHKRAEELTSPYYSRFSRTTLSIVQGDFAAALEEAKLLKADLEKDDAFWEGRDKFIKSGTILYAYNLIRIAALERQTGSKEGELLAWQELERSAGWKEQPANPKTYDPEAYALLEQNFSQGDVSLLDFIEQRKKELMR